MLTAWAAHLVPRDDQVRAAPFARNHPHRPARPVHILGTGQPSPRYAHGIAATVRGAGQGRHVTGTNTIEASEARYRGLLEAAPDAMIVVDRGGLIVTANLRTSTQFGYEPGELVGEPVTTIIPDGFAERLRSDDLRSVEDARAQEIGNGIELAGRRKDGSEFPAEI
ncbi:MAG: hypothetical protein QOJ75_2113, partial [Chloroflexota bacterium]|nr:hypothetical protein [Chloroflexota bacterium]